MSSGVVTKIVRAFGSEWGRVRTAQTGIDCFFNKASMLHPGEFETLSLGQEVTFDSEPDMVNGFRAAHLTILSPRSRRAKASL
jgi:cold shock CspA family protein